MSAIASVLAAQGHEVSGSDLKKSVALLRLEALGIPVTVFHAPENVQGAEVLIASPAVRSSNPEIRAAEAAGIEIMSRAEALAAITRRRRTISVAGTNGKTTTTSMLAMCLVQAGLHPSFMIGGDLNEVGTNAVWDEGEWLVVEADESDGTFLELDSDIGVVTNIEADHLDHYGSVEALESAFERFGQDCREALVVGADDCASMRVGQEVAACRDAGVVVRSVGLSEDAAWRIVDVNQTAAGSSFGLAENGSVAGTFTIPVVGIHNVRNAAVAAVAAVEAGGTFGAAARALATFGGVARRFEQRGSFRGARLVDDYAHLPGEVAVTLEAARLLAPQRLVAVFQPHRYSRTRDVGPRFGPPLGIADLVVVTDVYPAGEDPLPGVSGRVVADAVSACKPGLPVYYVPGRAELVELVRGLLREGDLCISLGAGDITSLATDLMADRHGQEVRGHALRCASTPSSDRAGATDQAGRLEGVLGGIFGERLVRDFPLGAATTYRVGGRASLMVRVESVAEMEALAGALAAAETSLPLLVLGKGSNMLIADGGFPGLVVTLGDGLAGMEVLGAEPIATVRAGAGLAMPVMARKAVALGLSGLEWCVGVPGTVGGAVRMNAGGHGSDISQVLESCMILDLRTGRWREAGSGQLELGYRSSNVSADEVVLQADLRVNPPGSADLERRIAELEGTLAEIVHWRRENQPGGSNAGSVFVNPPGQAAGALVEQAGLKGFRLGTATVSEKHANFLQVDPGGSADDVKRLIDYVAEVVLDRSGIELRTEVRLVGFRLDAGP